MMHLQQSQARVKECTEQLEQLAAQTQQLQDDYQEKMKMAAKLETDLERTQSILD